MSDDLISRQAALDSIDTWDKFGCDPDGRLVRYDDDKHYVPYVHYDDMVHAIKALPSAQPEKTQLSGESTTKDSTFDCISRQAAIDALKNRWKKTRNYEGIGDDIAEECELYLKQLPSAQPPSCKDAVSKADVLETYAELYDVFDDNKEIKNELHKIYDKINALQAAQPQRMKGKWERHYNRPNVFADLYWHCSICGYKNSENWANIYHRYCPHCGSEMLLESHEEVSYSPSSGADMRGDEDE